MATAQHLMALLNRGFVMARVLSIVAAIAPMFLVGGCCGSTGR
jgi:hypothetical protein